MTLETYNIQQEADVVVKEANLPENVAEVKINSDSQDNLVAPTRPWFLQREKLATLGKAAVLGVATVAGIIDSHLLISFLPTVELSNLIRNLAAPELSGGAVSFAAAARLFKFNFNV